MIVFVVILCVLINIFLLWNVYFINRKRAMNLPPLASGALPIVGHLILAFVNKKRLYQVLVDILLGPLIKKGANAATIRFGPWDVYVLMNPEDAYLLSNECLKKDKIYEFFKPLFGDEGLVTADVPVWKRHRKLLNPAFNQSVLDGYLTEFNHQSQMLVKHLAPEVGKGSFNQLPYIRQAMLQTVSATIFGTKLIDSDFTHKLGEATELFTKCVTERYRKFWYQNDFLFSLSNLKKKQEETARFIQEIINQIFKKKEVELNVLNCKANKSTDSTEPRIFKSFSDLLLDLSKEGALTESEMKEEVNSFYGAGFDSTYHVLGIVILVLGSYPEVQQKVFAELQEVFNGTYRNVEKQDISKLKYLEAVIKEVMRLYPVVVGIGRILDKDMIFKNYKLPAGSRCFMSIYHVGRHPIWGSDAEQFRPERWLDGSLPTNTRAFAVFGLGKRSCIGSNYAMMLMKTVLSHVIRRYHISGDVTQLVQQLDVIVTPASGHHISIECREEQQM